MGTCSNMIFQYQNTMNPLTEQQLKVNYIYWVVSLISVTLLVSSFKRIQLVVLVLMIYTIRNIAPLYDPENRRYLMDQSNWNTLIVFQVLVSAFNLLLMNLIIERCFFPISFVLTMSIYAGIFHSFFSGEL